MKQNFKIIKGIFRRSEKPLTLEGVILRWTDKVQPRNLKADLDEMVKLSILTAPVNGYYSLIKEDAKNG